VKEFFEKEVMNQDIDFWFPQEELVFVTPIIPHIEEYLVSIEKKDSNGDHKKILNQRIDIKIINKITN